MTLGGLTQGLLHLPGANYQSKALVERLLAEDFEKHHCYRGLIGLHNHLSHHLLAVYDLGAPDKVLQQIYDAEAKEQSPVNLINRKEQKTGSIDLVVTQENWTEHLGPEQHYPAYLAFFKVEVTRLGVPQALEEYIFSPKANGNGSSMLMRLVSAAIHAIIQVGYGIEFNEPLLVVSGLAQAAVTNPMLSSLYDDSLLVATASSDPKPKPGLKSIRQPSCGPSLLSILKQVYESDILHPVMPYNPDAPQRISINAMFTNGRPEEICRLSALWTVDPDLGDAEFDARVEELIWLTTLVTVATGKHGRKPRLDFFLMHLLTTTLFLPSFLRVLPSPESKVRLLRIMVPLTIMYIVARGRPRVDPTLIMSYTAYPRPPLSGTQPAPYETAIGDPRDAEQTNPWATIAASAIYAPEAHVSKAIRTLYYAAQRFGTTPPGGAIGAFDENGEETIKGTAEMDGTIFVRAAGVLMDTLGWVSRGQKEGEWDRSALGWDAAWDGPD